MKKILSLLVYTRLITSFAGCSDKDNSIAIHTNPPCNTNEILNLPGSQDAPFLYIVKDSDINDIYLCWTKITGSYYEVQECINACFNSFVDDYVMYDDYFTEVVKNNYFYRVRSISPAGVTGWSNVVIGERGGKL
jgi:hypothetical protein